MRVQVGCGATASVNYNLNMYSIVPLMFSYSFVSYCFAFYTAKKQNGLLGGRLRDERAFQNRFKTNLVAYYKGSVFFERSDAMAGAPNVANPRL